jgi:Flp pilus assembly protein TadG
VLPALVLQAADENADKASVTPARLGDEVFGRQFEGSGAATNTSRDDVVPSPVARADGPPVARRLRSRRRGRGERGASMVEFSLVLPLLVLVVFGAIEFGKTFNDYQALRQGAREAAREGAVGTFGPTFTTGSPCYLTGASGASDNIKDLMCLTKQQIGLDASKLRVKVLSGASDFSTAGTFAKDHSMIVCAQYPLDTVTSIFSPFLGGKTLRTKAAIRVEKSDLTATGGEETAPSGADWDWCTVAGSSP